MEPLGGLRRRGRSGAGVRLSRVAGSGDPGRDGWRAYRDQIKQGSSDFHNDVVYLVASGERAAVRLRYTDTHTGPLLGVAATGRVFGYDGAAFFTAQDGLLVGAWVLGDVEGLRRQLT